MDIWRTHHAAGMILLCLLFPLYFYNRIGLLACLLWSYCLGQAAIVTFYPGLYERPFVTMSLATMLRHGAGQALALTIILPFYAIKLKSKWMDILSYLLILNLIPVIIMNYGLFNVKSMDVTAMAIGVTYLLAKNIHSPSKLNVLMASIGISGIVLTGGRTGIVSLAVGAVSLFITSRRLSKTLFLFLALAGSIGSYFLYPYLVLKFPSFETRVIGWETIMTWWMTHGNQVFGMGPGSFEWLVPFIKIPTGEQWIWMHNDYLQYLFEYGWLGSVLAVALLIQVLYKAYNTYLFPPIMCSLVAMMGYFPLHFFTTQFLILFFVIKSLDKKDPDC